MSGEMVRFALVGCLAVAVQMGVYQLLLPYAAEAVANTVAYVVANLYPGMFDLTLGDLFGGNQQRVLMAVAFSFCLLLPALFQLNQRMKRAEEK